MVKKKDLNLEIIRVFAMSFVILTHILSNGFTEKENLNNVLYYIGKSAVPLFLILSGYTNSISYSRKKWTFLKLIQKLFVILMYYTLATLFYALINHRDFWTDFFTIQGTYHLYFLVILFLLEALFPCIYLWIKNNASSCLVSLTFFSIIANYFLMYNFSEILFVSPFTWGILFSVGIFFQIYEILNHVSTNLFGFFTFLLLVLYYELSILQLDRFISEIFFNCIIRHIFSICLFVFLYKGASLFLRSPFINYLVAELSKRSIYIYLIHPFLINLLNTKLFLHIIIMHGVPYCFLSFLFVFVLSFFCSILIEKIMDILKLQILNLLAA